MKKIEILLNQIASAEGGECTVLSYINAFDLKMQGFVLLAAGRQAGRLCIRKRFVHPTTVCSSSE